jgi:beta-lactam-binding protein with PASTA domain
MTWWGILIIVAVAVLAAIIITWLLVRSSKAALIAKKEMAEAAARTTAKKLEAERATRKKLEAESRALVAKMRKIDTWYQGALVVLTKEKRDAFEALSSDPDALDRKLDELLGTERDTDPG